jgi:hypothetical protein
VGLDPMGKIREMTFRSECDELIFSQKK